MCAFGTEEYYKLLELTLISIKLFSKTVGADFLVFTCKEFEERLKALVATLELPLEILIVDAKTPHEASSYKLHIFNYEKINDYSKLLYVDIDILVQGDLMQIFDLCKDDKLYAATQDTIGSHDGLGATFFDFSKIDRNTPAINAGVLLFKNSPVIRLLFTTINKHISDMKQLNINLPACYEQPFVNYHAVSAGLFEPILDYIHLTYNTWPGHEIPISPLKSSVLINHFIGAIPIGKDKWQSKLIQEGYHMTHLLDSYKDIVKSNSMNASILYRKQYTWGAGRIVFELNGLLITTWSRTGTYEVLNSHVVKASWSGFEHILIFNNTYTQFISIRISDSMINLHKIDTTLCDLIPIPSQPSQTVLTGSKNLLYFCVFYNRGYLELLTILLQSLIQSSDVSEIDILVFTNLEFISFIKELSLKINKPISIHTCNFTTQHEAGCARLSIFDYYKVNDYSKILYMDCDIVIRGDISYLFKLEIEDKVYAKQEYSVGGEGHGGWFFDFNTIDEKTSAINSGILLFPNTGKIYAVFKDIRAHIQSTRASKTLLPLCMDQSFIVYHLYKNGLYDNQLISPYIFLAEFTQPPTEFHKLLLCHFVWPIGNTQHKKNRILEYLASVKRLNELQFLV
jgi:lipopolysaccharide biosynthesis glycosyltransferase